MFHSAFKKDTEKVVLLEVKGLMQVIVKFRAEKILFMFLLIKHRFEGHEISITKTYNCAHLKMKGSFHSASYTIWFMISEKKISQDARFITVVHACTESLNKAYKKFSQPFKLPLCGLVVFIDMNEHCMYILTEGGGSFKTLWK